jgi:hypothetical protein
VTEGSPLVRDLRWGEVDTDAGTFRDAKLWPGGGRGWDWNETGTAHVPGVQPADVAELLEHGATRVVLSQGQQRRLQVTDAALEAVRAQGADPEVLPTGEAISRYNELAEAGEPVGALLHSTC